MEKQARKARMRLGASSNRARAINQLDQMAGFGRQVNRIAKASTNLKTGAAYRWQLPTQVPLVQFERVNTPTNFDGSQSHSGEALNRNETNRERKAASAVQLSGLHGHANALRRAASMVDAGGRISKKSRELNSAIESWSPAEGSVESGERARVISNASRRAIDVAKKVVVPNIGSSQRLDRAVSSGSQKDVDGAASRFAERGLSARARNASIRGASTLPNVSQRVFAEPAGRARGSNSGSMSTGITINSSPMVVINAPASGGNTARDVISALRTYREELFDQMKRESTRRERVQF
jgi:hypothetical protein